MANSKSAEKSARVTARKTVINRRVTSALKTTVKMARNSTEDGDVAAAQRSTRAAVSSLDKAGSRGYIHPNKASRTTSRLMKDLNKMMSDPTPSAKPKAGSGRRGSAKKK